MKSLISKEESKSLALYQQQPSGNNRLTKLNQVTNKMKRKRERKQLRPQNSKKSVSIFSLNKSGVDPTRQSIREDIKLA